MEMKEAALKVMESVQDIPVRQCDLVRQIEKLTKDQNYVKDSVRSNVFRNRDMVPSISTDFIKTTTNKGTFYVRGKNEYHQEYNKPKEYFEFLYDLNTSEKVYTLCGTESHCSTVIDSSKLIKVDKSPLIKLNDPNYISGDIFKLDIDGNVNFDYEGRMTSGKVTNINNLKKTDKIVLTIKKDKHTKTLLEQLEYKIVGEKEYKCRRHNMCVFLLHKKTHL